MKILLHILLTTLLYPLSLLLRLSIYLTHPIGYLWVRFITGPRIDASTFDQWRDFKLENHERIEEWMRTHEDSEKLPIIRGYDGLFRWMNRGERRNHERRLNVEAKKRISML